MQSFPFGVLVTFFQLTRLAGCPSHVFYKLYLTHDDDFMHVRTLPHLWTYNSSSPKEFHYLYRVAAVFVLLQIQKNLRFLSSLFDKTVASTHRRKSN